MKLLNSKQAMAYLGMGRTTFEHHITQGNIEIDMRSGRNRIFSAAKLQIAKSKIKDEKNYTRAEIANMCYKFVCETGGWTYEAVLEDRGLDEAKHVLVKGKVYKRLSKDVIFYHFSRRNITPIGKRSGANTFSLAAVKMVAESENWLVIDNRDLSQHPDREGKQ